MKKKLTLLLLSALTLSFSLQAQQVEKVLVKSINPEATKSVLIQMNYPVEVQTWSGKIIRVQMNVGLENGSENILKSLVSAGRYNVRAKANGEIMVLTLPSMAKEVRVGGQELKESISLTVFIPETMFLQEDIGIDESVGMTF